MARPGKKITTWSFERNGKRFQFTVRLRETPYHTEFYVEETIAGVRVAEKHEDINRLKALVEEEVTKNLTITWTPKLCVTVKGSCVTLAKDDNARTELKVIIVAYEVGVRADGAHVYRTPGSYYIEEGDLEADSASTSYMRDENAALIDDTPENRAALDKILQAMAQLRTGLCAFLSPEAVLRTLSQVRESGAFNLALPAPVPMPSLAKKKKT